ncbi:MULTISPECIES: hypothetical protein [Arthrospira]|uniref:hypothetical protein n=1 Tax=Oscillatoriales TaxID=1150 RepID=UPI001E3FA2F0|nr:hypothetical protein [Arthrospira platensis NCB002]QQW32091.2 hypothetical protein AP9108_17830 [Arthrospira sp. PCC 9108]
MFGPNAQLNIGGSFLASTADRLIFNDGTQLSTQPQSPPLLYINTPLMAAIKRGWVNNYEPFPSGRYLTGRRTESHRFTSATRTGYYASGGTN